MNSQVGVWKNWELLPECVTADGAAEVSELSKASPRWLWVQRPLVPLCPHLLVRTIFRDTQKPSVPTLSSAWDSFCHLFTWWTLSSLNAHITWSSVLNAHITRSSPMVLGLWLSLFWTFWVFTSYSVCSSFCAGIHYDSWEWSYHLTFGDRFYWNFFYPDNYSLKFKLF